MCVWLRRLLSHSFLLPPTLSGQPQGIWELCADLGQVAQGAIARQTHNAVSGHGCVGRASLAARRWSAFSLTHLGNKIVATTRG